MTSNLLGGIEYEIPLFVNESSLFEVKRQQCNSNDVKKEVDWASVKVLLKAKIEKENPNVTAINILDRNLKKISCRYRCYGANQSCAWW